MSESKINTDILDRTDKVNLCHSFHLLKSVIQTINVAQLSAGTYIIAFGKDGIASNSTKFIVK